jgi:hypothetical protein
MTVACIDGLETELNAARDYVLSLGYSEARVARFLGLPARDNLMKSKAGMNDHASPATAQVNELERELLTRCMAANPQLSQDEALAAVKLVRGTCFNHKKELVGNDAVAQETILMKKLRAPSTVPAPLADDDEGDAKMGDDEQGEEDAKRKCEEEEDSLAVIAGPGNPLDALVRELYKCFEWGQSPYHLSKGFEFKTWMEKRKLGKWRPFFRAVGSKHDKRFESALTICWLFEEIVEWLSELELCEDARDINKLIKAIASALPTVEVKAGFLARAIFFLQVGEPWRVVINDNEVGSTLGDMGGYCEELTATFTKLVVNPELAMERDFRTFQSDIVQQRVDEFRGHHKEEVEHVLTMCRDVEVEPLIKQFLQHLVIGAQEGVGRLCVDFLPGGQYHHATCSPEVLRILQGMTPVSDAIESVWGGFDWVDKTHPNLGYLSKSGMVMCRVNKTFKTLLGRPGADRDMENALVQYTINRVPEARAADQADAKKLETHASREQELKKLKKKEKRERAVYQRKIRFLTAPFLASREELDEALEKAGKALTRKREVYEDQWRWFRDKLGGQKIKVPAFKQKVNHYVAYCSRYNIQHATEGSLTPNSPQDKHRSLAEYSTLWGEMMVQLTQSPQPAGPPHWVPTFDTAPGLTTTGHRRALVQQAGAACAAESEESERKAVLAWEEKQEVERAKAEKKEKVAKDKKAAKEQKTREREQKRETKVREKDHKAQKAREKAREKELNKEHREKQRAQTEKNKKTAEGTGLTSKRVPASKRRAQKGNNGERPKKKRVKKIYCTCRGPAGEKPMIGCDGCKEWYHFDCLGIDTEEEIAALQSEDIYLCPTCEPGAALL